MRIAVIVLNGASSAGKSSITLELQRLLPRPVLVFGVDTLVASMPAASSAHEPGIVFGSNGVVAVDDRFRQLEHAWYQGLAAIARDGVGVIIDEVFLGGGESQDRLRSALGDLRVVWVGVHCDLEIAVAREVARP
ncbi:MAG: chloramphenicol phosphotransferase, partial [Pseudonocardia sp.]|nr:chloramphenicol phosphotransferase [Pseudonocardia sp.]